jgi:uncharacterized damage-inducible protein DinB
MAISASATHSVPSIASLLEEFRAEMPATRRVLERVPNDKLTWKPHTKSRSLGELANHVAGIPGLIANIATQHEFSPTFPLPAPPATADEIRAKFDQNVKAGEEALSKLTDEAAKEDWRLVFKGKEVVRRPRASALRTNVLNHVYHHRAQLGVYLRLLDVPVPIVYGPTADENPFA